ncbi:MAG: hypothetical protein GEU91_00800 [Rhizobiales bacterium]|nr:hypothetical protein [Hyphomicrobiales bacterium]
MAMLTRVASSGLAFLFGSLVWITPPSLAFAATITTQARCAGPDGYCLSFGSQAAIPVIRSINFAAPKAGTAQVTFHGSLYCAGQATSFPLDGARMAFVDFASQIVNKQNDVADFSKGGSLRHAAYFIRYDISSAFDWSTTFNLASTRVFQIDGAGTQRYYFKIARLLQNAGVTCYLYNATFTVVFI